MSNSLGPLVLSLNKIIWLSNLSILGTNDGYSTKYDIYVFIILK
jgi:hypothetical protein